MTKVVLRRAATRDLAAIGRHIAKDNPGRARSFRTELYDKCKNLDDFPGRGSPRPDVAPDLRQLVHGNYLILYRYDRQKDAVFILRITEGHRDVTALATD